MTDYASVLESYTIPEYEIATEGMLGNLVGKIFSVLSKKILVVIGLITAFIASASKSKHTQVVDDYYNKTIKNNHAKYLSNRINRMLTDSYGAVVEIKNFTESVSKFFNETDKMDVFTMNKFYKDVNTSNYPNIMNLSMEVESYKNTANDYKDILIDIDKKHISKLSKEKELLEKINQDITVMSKDFLARTKEKSEKEWHNKITKYLSDWGKYTGTTIKNITEVIIILKRHSKVTTK